MYIIWIGWLYVVLMFALGQRTLPMTAFVLIVLGVLPTWLLLFVVRRRQVPLSQNSCRLDRISNPGR